MLGPKPGGGEVNFPADPDIFALSEIQDRIHHCSSTDIYLDMWCTLNI